MTRATHNPAARKGDGVALIASSGFFVALLCILITACGPSEEEVKAREQEAEAMADSLIEALIAEPPLDGSTDNSETPLPDGEIIGQWKDDTPMIENVKIIYKADDKLKIQTTYKDGSQSDDELIEKQENGKTRYDFVDNPHGEYFIVEDNGNLGMYGENGKFSEAKKVE